MKREQGAYGLGPQYFQSRTVKFANIGTDSDVEAKIDNNAHKTDEILRKMAEHLGKDKLEALEPKQLFEVYREFARHK